MCIRDSLKIDTTDRQAINVSCTITNTGRVAGEEVAQLYIRDRVSSLVRPVKELKGFQKFTLEPGASQNVQFVLTDAELGFYDVDGQWLVEPGEFDVMIGTSSVKGLVGRFSR